MKSVKLNLILIFLFFFNLLSFSYSQWIDVHFSPIPENPGTKGKIFVRKIIDMRIEKGVKPEEQDFTLAGLLRNGYGIPFPSVGVLPGHELDLITKNLIVNALKNAGYDAVAKDTDGSAPVIDIGLLRCMSDGYSYGFVTSIELRIMLYSADGKTKIFETEIADNQGYAWSITDMEDSCPAWTLTLSKLSAYASIVFNSKPFTDAYGGKKISDKTAVDLRDSKLKEITVKENPESIISATFLDNKISKISNLDKYPNLLILNLKENSIGEISGLDSCPNLEALVLKNNKFKKIENLSGLKNLRLLDIGYNSITKIENLNDLKQLEWLIINDCDDITKIENLDSLTNLTGLDLNNCKNISKIENLDSLKKLTFLSFATCQNITAISGLENLANLKELIISKTGITKLENLDKLASLEYLDISFNKIKKLEDLSNLKNLKKLVIFKSPVEALENLESLTNLKEIIITKNYIITPKPKLITKATYDRLKSNNVVIDGQMNIDQYMEKYNAKIAD